MCDKSAFPENKKAKLNIAAEVMTNAHFSTDGAAICPMSISQYDNMLENNDLMNESVRTLCSRTCPKDVSIT